MIRTPTNHSMTTHNNTSKQQTLGDPLNSKNLSLHNSKMRNGVWSRARGRRGARGSSGGTVPGRSLPALAPRPPAPPLVQPGGRSLRRGHLGHHLIKFNHRNLVTAMLYGLTTPLCTNKPPPPPLHTNPPTAVPSVRCHSLFAVCFRRGRQLLFVGFVFVATSRTRLT